MPPATVATPAPTSASPSSSSSPSSDELGDPTVTLVSGGSSAHHAAAAATGASAVLFSGAFLLVTALVLFVQVRCLLRCAKLFEQVVLLPAVYVAICACSVLSGVFIFHEWTRASVAQALLFGAGMALVFAGMLCLTLDHLRSAYQRLATHHEDLEFEYAGSDAVLQLAGGGSGGDGGDGDEYSGRHGAGAGDDEDKASLLPDGDGGRRADAGHGSATEMTEIASSRGGTAIEMAASHEDDRSNDGTAGALGGSSGASAGLRGEQSRRSADSARSSSSSSRAAAVAASLRTSGMLDEFEDDLPDEFDDLFEDVSAAPSEPVDESLAHRRARARSLSATAPPPPFGSAVMAPLTALSVSGGGGNSGGGGSVKIKFNAQSPPRVPDSVEGSGMSPSLLSASSSSPSHAFVLSPPPPPPSGLVSITPPTPTLARAGAALPGFSLLR